MPDPALRDRLAKILDDAWPHLDGPSWKDWRVLADALLASEEWQAREAVVEAAKAYFPDGFLMREGDRIAVGMNVLQDLCDALARLAAVRRTR